MAKPEIRWTGRQDPMIYEVAEALGVDTSGAWRPACARRERTTDGFPWRT